jgi:hypothetical protein
MSPIIAIVLIVLLALYVSSCFDINDKAKRRHERNEFANLASNVRGRQQMAAELRPAYPPPPEMPSEDVQ